MNIVTPVPTTLNFSTVNPNTELAKRDNQLRETVPQTADAENSAAESGLGSESDRVKKPGQPPQPVTYERPQPQSGQQAQGETRSDQDNAEDPSAGKESAQDEQSRQQQQAQQQEVQELEKRDQEVRQHEQAHAAQGGQHAGSPSYEFEVGPDGQQYAVSGEVSIDISKEATPEDTLRKMQQVKAAALAPAEPSVEDVRVAAEATKIAAEARAEISSDRLENSQQTFQQQSGLVDEADSQSDTGPELEDIVQGTETASPYRTLAEDPVAEAAGLESGEWQRKLASRDEQILKRVSVIENYYQQVALPEESRAYDYRV